MEIPRNSPCLAGKSIILEKVSWGNLAIFGRKCGRICHHWQDVPGTSDHLKNNWFYPGIGICLWMSNCSMTFLISLQMNMKHFSHHGKWMGDRVSIGMCHQIVQFNGHQHKSTLFWCMGPRKVLTPCWSHRKSMGVDSFDQTSPSFHGDMIYLVVNKSGYMLHCWWYRNPWVK